MGNNRAPGSQWAKALRIMHGLRPEQWHAMFREQDGRCYLCERPLPVKRMLISIDHDYSCCGRNRSCSYCRRGLACRNCNTAIGMFGDDPERLRIAASNLERQRTDAKARIMTKPAQGELL